MWSLSKWFERKMKAKSKSKTIAEFSKEEPENTQHNHQQEHIQYRIRRGQIPCRGVNLGGWLVAEHWITWDSIIWKDVPSEIADQGEFATMKYIGHEEGDKRFDEHRNTWITEEDIREMASFGINTIRVPVGYWIAGFDYSDISNKQEWKVFAPNGLMYLDTLIFDWCVHYNIAVLISIHAAKGSQNGRDHSAAPTPGVTYWSNYQENVENTAQFALFLAERYKYCVSFLGLSLLNEPQYPVHPRVVRNYFLRAYYFIRGAENDCILVTSPMLHQQSPPHMERFMLPPGYKGVWHEWHPYFKWGYEGQNEGQILDAVQRYSDQIDAWRGNPLLISEWSLASPETAPFQDLNQLSRHAKLQIQAYEKAKAGWIFWTWKISQDIKQSINPWSMRQLLNAKRLYPLLTDINVTINR
jgi:glucan 1,3-beta-glucosidase